MFKLDEPAAEQVSITVDGKNISVPAGATVASVLLEQGKEPFRTSSVTGEVRSPHCLMGVCCECLCEIDGVKDRQACLEEVHEGMQVNRQIVEGGE